MNRRRTIYLAVALALLTGWYLFAFSPLRARQADLSVKISAAEAKLDDYQKTVKQIPDFIATQSKLADRRKELQSRLYGKDELLSLFAHLRQLADKRHLTIVEVTPPIQELLKLATIDLPAEQPPFLEFSLAMTGDYISFGRFVTEIEAEPFFRGFTTARVRAPERDDSELKERLGVRVLLYSGTGAS
jgi:Tfp pilus assembly protein PilO